MPDRGRIHYDMVGIASLLARMEFRVPIYQRSYAWNSETVGDYWHDLKYALDSGEPDYFLGTVVLTPADDRSTPDRYRWSAASCHHVAAPSGHERYLD